MIETTKKKTARTLAACLTVAAMGLSVVAACGGEGSPAAGSAGGAKVKDTADAGADRTPGTSPEEKPAEKPAAASGDYCAAAKKSGEVLKNPDPGQGSQLVPALQKIEQAAPADIKPKWTAYVKAMTDFERGQDLMKDPKKMSEGKKVFADVGKVLETDAKDASAHLIKTCGAY